VRNIFRWTPLDQKREEQVRRTHSSWVPRRVDHHLRPPGTHRPYGGRELRDPRHLRGLLNGVPQTSHLGPMLLTWPLDNSGAPGVRRLPRDLRFPKGRENLNKWRRQPTTSAHTRVIIRVCGGLKRGSLGGLGLPLASLEVDLPGAFLLLHQRGLNDSSLPRC
jgi:hypothetical protein